MSGGAPRTVCPPPEEMIELGKEMIAWVQEHQPVHLSEWWSFEKFFTKAAWKNMCDRSEFAPYYEKALLLVGQQYLRKDSPVEPSLKQRWQRVYHKDLRDQEDEDKEKDAALAQKTDTSTPQDRIGFNRMMDWLAEQQKKSDKTEPKQCEDQSS